VPFDLKPNHICPSAILCCYVFCFRVFGLECCTTIRFSFPSFCLESLCITNEQKYYSLRSFLNLLDWSKWLLCGFFCQHVNMFSNSFISSNLIHNSYINYIKLNACTCFERHPIILRRSVSLIIHVCSLWYSHSLQVAVLCACYGETHKTATCREWEYWRLHTCIINDIDLLRMSGWCSKHVEAFNFM